jgi:hypothetical protein
MNAPFKPHLGLSKIQRIVVIVYCVLLAYCCLWIPWHLVQGQDNIRAGYGWLWRGPQNAPVDPLLTSPDHNDLSENAYVRVGGRSMIPLADRIFAEHTGCFAPTDGWRTFNFIGIETGMFAELTRLIDEPD